MTLKELLTIVGGAVFAIMSLLEVSKIKVNPWSALARLIGRAINKELFDEIAGLKKDFADMKKASDEEKAVNLRDRILRFGDETIHGTKHTQEHFNQILDDITEYELYCSTHPEFPNEKTVITASRIKEIYGKCLATNDFL